MLGLDIACVQNLNTTALAVPVIWLAGAHQNLNGSRDLTAPISGMITELSSVASHLLRPTYLPNLKSLSPPTTKT